METLEELIAIVENAPDDATHYLVNQYDFIEGYFKLDNCNCLCDYGDKGWVDIDEIISIDGNHYVRDLSDIKRIIELMEATQGLLQVFAGSPDGYWRNELNAARKALGVWGER